MNAAGERYANILDTCQNVRAFLAVIYSHESGGDYHKLVGGGRFESLADHPRQRVWLPGLKLYSTAAGAPQFLERTWDGVVKQIGLTDFSERSQDIGAVCLIDGRHALDDVIAGRLRAAILKCNKEWASLPLSPYGQPTQTIEQAQATYLASGGTLEVTQPQPQPQPAPVAGGRKTMGFTELALASLFNGIPKLLDLFKGDSTVAARNVEGAKVLIDTAKKAIGARNEQEIVEAMRDPEQAATIRQAVEANWLELYEVAGGVSAARDFGIKAAASEKPFWYNPSFVISVLLMVYPTMLLVDVFYVHPAGYDGNLRTQIVTAVLLIIGMVGAFWLGTSASSQRKTNIMASQAQQPRP